TSHFVEERPMTVFRHILWGYELTYPEGWVHQEIQDADAFAQSAEAFDPYYAGSDAGHLQVRGEWNWQRQPIEPLWNKHIGMLAGMMGAKEVGSAPWRLGDAVGLEAEIVLPKKDNMRLWTGILMRDFRVLHFMVTHPKEVREQFEPAATKIISSLRFPSRILGIRASREGIPVPPDYSSVDPLTILADIQDPQNWRAYSGKSGIGALQAFYVREVPIHNWEMEEYVPFPSDSELGFSRLQLRRDKTKIMLGLMPYDTSGYEASGTVTSSSPANIVYKIALIPGPSPFGGRESPLPSGEG
ncbi:MAG: hypothetical protein AB1649_02270, partial [Chloroflexota bacterium]